MRRAGLATMAIVFLGIAVVLAATVLRLGRTPATGQGTGPGSESTASVRASGVATPSLPPSVGPSPTASPWKVLATSDTAGAVWSPDGRWLLVWDQVTNDTPAQRHVSLDDAHGNLVRTFQGENPLWLDARSFVLTHAGRNYLGTVDSSALTPIAPTFSGGVYANGRGALAYETSGPFDASARFVVWTLGGRTTSPVPGVPVAWSRDGTKLAIWHWTSGPSGPTVSGWLEVLGWPGLRSLAAVRDRSASPLGHQTWFDPSGRYLAFLCGGVCTLDLTTGTTTLVPGPSVSSDLNAWNQASQLVVPSLTDGSASVYDVHGVRQAVYPNVGDSATASADGSTVALWFNSAPQPVALLRQGTLRRIDVPGPVQAPIPQLSPDGTGLVVVCVVGGHQEALLLGP